MIWIYALLIVCIGMPITVTICVLIVGKWIVRLMKEDDDPRVDAARIAKMKERLEMMK